MSEKAEHSMKIFISYGHPEADICRRIMKRLRERGHNVWFDEEQIQHGENWRRRIESGIETSQGVISCLSKHSVRDPGVCLDELSIAVGVKGGNIFTVLLESEREVRPPASICHLQWVDMHDWRQRWGTPDFEPWFEARMEQIIERIESPESVRFAGEIEELKKRLTVDYSTGKQRSLLSQAFVGREWLTDEVRAWLDDPNGAPLCVLYGDPGVGKSAFAARFGHYNQAVAASLFLECDQPHYKDARSVIMTLAYLLACRIVDFRRALLTALEGLDLSRFNESALFDRLIAEPARLCIDGARDTMCIVIDGLDESSGPERNALAEVLSDDYVRRLPRWLRILVTSREVTEVMAPLEGAFQLTLHGSEARNQADIRAYFAEMLGEKFGSDPAWPAALDALAERSDGIFLYARLVVDGLRNGRMGIHDVTQFPQGLSAAFHRWFSWFFPSYEEFDQKYRLPLGMILASKEPLPRDELMRTLNWSKTEQTSFICRIQVLLLQDTDDFGQATLRFSHQYLMEWLAADSVTQPYAVNRQDSIAAMARAFYRYFEKDPDALTFYEALHLVDYLRQSGENSRAHEAEMRIGLLNQINDAGDHCRTWGKLDHALACYRQALAMAEVMCAERNAPEYRRSLSVTYDRMASVFDSQGKLDVALALTEKGLALDEQLVLKCGTPDDRVRLSISYTRIASIWETQEKLDEALVFYKKALAITEQLVSERGTPRDRGDLCFGCNNVADILKAKGKLDEALALYVKALAIAELLVSERDTLDDRRTLGFCYNNMAGILVAQGKTDEALALYEKSLAIAEQLVRERGTPADRGGLSANCNNVAGILETQGKLDEALALYEKSLAIREQLVRERGTPGDRRDLGASYERIAIIREAQGKLDEALALHEKTLAIREQLAHECGTPGDRRDLGFSYERIAAIRETQDKLDEALAQYKKTLAIREQLVHEFGTPDDRRSLGFCYGGMAIILMAQNKSGEALAFCEKNLALHEQLVHEFGIPNDRRNLSLSYAKSAAIWVTRLRLNKALALCEKARAIAEPLVREYNTLQDRRNLYNCYWGIAAIRMMQLRLNKALAFYEQALAIAEQLVSERGGFQDWNALATALHAILHLPNLPRKSKLAYAQRGLEIAQKLLEQQPSDRYRKMVKFFESKMRRGPFGLFPRNE